MPVSAVAVLVGVCFWDLVLGLSVNESFVSWFHGFVDVGVIHAILAGLGISAIYPQFRKSCREFCLHSQRRLKAKSLRNSRLLHEDLERISCL